MYGYGQGFIAGFIVATMFLIVGSETPLAKKQAAQHPDSKDAKTDDKSRKRTAPPVGAGKVMKKAAGRGR